MARPYQGPTSVPGPYSVDPFDEPTLGPPTVLGNVDLYRQPKVQNPDGSISTVDSSSYNIDGRETLLPSVTPAGVHLQSDDDIVNQYRRSGAHLGMFDSPEAATAHAQRLHEDYAAGKYEDTEDNAQARMYQPDVDIAFGDRVQQARAARPPASKGQAPVGRSTPSPFEAEPSPAPTLGTQADQPDAAPTLVSISPGKYRWEMRPGIPAPMGKEQARPMTAASMDPDLLNMQLPEIGRRDRAGAPSNSPSVPNAEGQYLTGEQRMSPEQLRAHSAEIRRHIDPAALHPATPLARRMKTRFAQDSKYGPLTPEQQIIVDDFEDEMSRWRQTDESGNVRYTATRSPDYGANPTNTQRWLDEQEAANRYVAPTPTRRRPEQL